MINNDWAVYTQEESAVIAINGEHADKRLNAVYYLRDQAVLTEVAKNDKDGKVRAEAASMLEDKALAREVFFDILNKIHYIGDYDEVAKRTDDQAVLAEIANNTALERACKSAAPALDPDEIKYIMEDVAILIARITAVEKLTDQDVLRDIAKKEKNGNIRIVAAKKLENQKLAQKAFADIIMKSTSMYHEARREAMEYLTDQAALAKIAKGDYGYFIADDALNKITDQALLADVALNSCQLFIGLNAADSLDDRALAQKAYAKIAKIEGKIYDSHDDDDEDCRLVALEGLTDQSMLEDVARNAKNGDIASMAARKLTDRDLAKEIMKYR